MASENLKIQADQIGLEVNSNLNDSKNLQNDNDSDNEIDYDDYMWSRKLTDRNYGGDFFCNLKVYTQSNEWSDIILVVKTEKFYCHRIILASASPFFATMFRCNMNEKDQSEIVLKSIDDEKVMKQVIKYMYTGTTVINKINMYKMFQAADFLQIASLRKLCVTYMMKIVNFLSSLNCIKMYQFAHLYKCDELLFESGKCFPSMVLRVPKVYKFLKLPVDVASDLLQRCHTSYDHSPEQEANVFNACVAWLKYDSSRNDYSSKIFQSVAFVALREEFLINVVMKENLVLNCGETMQIVNKTLQYFQTPLRRSEIDIAVKDLLLAQREKDKFTGASHPAKPLGTVEGTVVLAEKNNHFLEEETYLMNISHTVPGNLSTEPLCLVPSSMCGIFLLFHYLNSY